MSSKKGISREFFSIFMAFSAGLLIDRWVDSLFEVFDILLNKLAKKYPPKEANNAREWLALTRTIDTSLQILKLTALKALERR